MHLWEDITPEYPDQNDYCRSRHKNCHTNTRSNTHCSISKGFSWINITYLHAIFLVFLICCSTPVYGTSRLANSDVDVDAYLSIHSPNGESIAQVQLQDHHIQKRSVFMSPDRSDQEIDMLSSVQSQSDLTCNVTFLPEDISIEENTIQPVNFSLVCSYFSSTVINNSTWILQGLRLLTSIEDPEIAIIEGDGQFNYSIHDENIKDPDSNTTTAATTIQYSSGSADLTSSGPYIHQFTLSDISELRVTGGFVIQGLQFGRTAIILKIIPVVIGEPPLTKITTTDSDIAVIKQGKTTDLVFLIVIGAMLVIYNFGFGCKVEANLIIEIVKRPVAPAIGFVCQFLIMAPLSFGIAKLLNLSDEVGLGLLSIGSAPGGGGSNIFAYLLNGELELSITMTFISTIASLGMTPLWIWALGRYFLGTKSKIKIPVENVFSSLAIVTIPVIIGLLISKFKPKIAKKIAWCLKPATGVIGLIFITMGVYVYYPALRRVDWRTLVACLIVPLAGYIIGASAGKMFCQKRARWITIALETGFQNMALSLMIIGTSLTPPESDFAGVVPICYTFLSAALPVTVFLIKCCVLVHRGDKPWGKSETMDLKSPQDDDEEMTSSKVNGAYVEAGDVKGIVCISSGPEVIHMRQKTAINGTANGVLNVDIGSGSPIVAESSESVYL